MPYCRWVCVAIASDVQPEIEKEIRSEITLVIAPAVTVNSWYFNETGSKLQNSRDYRMAWVIYMLKQCRAMQEK